LHNRNLNIPLFSLGEIMPDPKLPENVLTQFLKDTVMPDQQEHDRQECIRHMCEMMFETPPAKEASVEDGRMKGLLSCWHDDKGQELAEQILSACMHTAKTTLKKGSSQRVFVQDFAAALNRRSLLRNDRVEDFTNEGYRYLDT
jgi:hypothetical protein